jgi:hypothetical protein
MSTFKVGDRVSFVFINGLNKKVTLEKGNIKTIEEELGYAVVNSDRGENIFELVETLVPIRNLRKLKKKEKPKSISYEVTVHKASKPIHEGHLIGCFVDTHEAKKFLGTLIGKRVRVTVTEIK